MQGVPATLVYLYGPPAAGKLTVAREVSAVTGFPLFHNHLTVNALTPVFGFGTPEFAATLHRLRLDVFRTAAASGRSLLFTNNSAWSGSEPRPRFERFAAEAEDAVGAAGGRCLFVQVTAPAEVLEARVGAEDREANGKLVDVARLRELLSTHDPSPLHEGDLVIDSSRVDPTGAAAAIVERLQAS